MNNPASKKAFNLNLVTFQDKTNKTGIINLEQLNKHIDEYFENFKDTVLNFKQNLVREYFTY